ALSQQDSTEPDGGDDRVRAEPERRPVGGLRVVESLLLAEDLGEVAVCPDVARSQAYGGLERRFGLCVPPLPVEGHAQASMKRRMVGTEQQSLQIRRLGLGVAALAAETQG